MRCPTLSELPPPPSGKACTDHGQSGGWPWTEERPQLPEVMPNPSAPSAGQVACSWPRVSIVTPSYNQGQFIEETIRSVLLQGYPNLEYIIVDGGSTDGSVEVIRKYEPWLAHWVSEPDDGQAAAINKGWQRATGDIVAWLNSDDLYEPGAVCTAASSLQDHPEVAMIYGKYLRIDQRGNPLPMDHAKPRIPPQIDMRHWLTSWECPIAQPSVFVRREILERVGMLDPALHFAMDMDLWVRIALVADLGYIPIVLSRARIHPAAKSGRLYTVQAQDVLSIANKVAASDDLPREFVPIRKQIRGGSYLFAARRYRKLGQSLRAVAATLRGFWIYPGYLFSKREILFILRATVDDLLLRRMPKVRSGLRELIRRRV